MGLANNLVDLLSCKTKRHLVAGLSDIFKNHDDKTEVIQSWFYGTFRCHQAGRSRTKTVARPTAKDRQDFLAYRKIYPLIRLSDNARFDISPFFQAS
jgi:hypothetical protein